MKTSLLFISLLLSCYLNAQYYGMDSVQFNSSFKGLALKPSDYTTNPAKRYPLIVTVGGNGEVGTQLNILFNQGIPRRLKLGKPMYQVMAPGDTARFLYVCLLPDVSTRGGQPNFMNAAIDYMVANYRVDTTKILVSGLSQGANDVLRYGLWTPTGDPNLGSFGGFDYRQQRVRFYVSSSPPLVGTPYSDYYSRFKTYGWGARFFHGTNDGGLTPPSGSQVMNDSINANHPGSSQRFLLAGYGHDANVWDSMYSTNGLDSNRNIYRWLVMSPSNVTVPPPVAVAGPPQTISSTSTILNAQASYSPNGSISAYNWQQVSGPGSVIIQNATTPTPLVSNMSPGSSYEFKLTVTDIVGASGSDSTLVTVMNILLPVNLVFFTGKNMGVDNLLQWETANELNNDYFSIERSEDGSQYFTISKVAGAGNSISAKEYSYRDIKAPPGNAFYRLKQVDKDGLFKFSSVLLITSGNKINIEEIYPNPVKENLNLVLNNETKGDGKIAIYDLAGRILKQEIFIKDEKIFNAAFNMKSLMPGFYIIEVKVGNSYKLTRRLMKQ